MQFNFLGFIMNQFVLMFATVTIGIAIGKLLRIGISGSLFIGLGIGWGILKYAKVIVANEASSQGALKAAKGLIANTVVNDMFFTMFLIFFVASVGLLSAERIGTVVKKYGVKFIILGFLITGAGAAATYFLSLSAKSYNPYEVTGVYTGALTSSPGLAAAIETSKIHAADFSEQYANSSDEVKSKIMSIIDKNYKGMLPQSLDQKQKDTFIINAETGVGVGHAIGYPWGVIIIILGMKFFPKIFRFKIDDEYKKFNSEMKSGDVNIKEIKPVTFDLLAFMFVCVFGYFIGVVEIYIGPLGWFSLSSTGGVLITALVFGHIGKIGPIYFRMNKQVLSAIRDIALSMFLAIVGLRYGYNVIDSLKGSGIFLSFVSILSGTFAMLIGFIVGRYVFKINWIMLSGAICGGMTSAPGLGAAIDIIGNDDPAAGYAATHPFALLGMVIFSIILHKLPIF